jgi:hypothetical protein
VEELIYLITAAIASATPKMLGRVWSEIVFRLDIGRVTREAKWDFLTKNL